MGLIFYRKKILAVTPRDLLILSWLGFLGMSAHTILEYAFSRQLPAFNVPDQAFITQYNAISYADGYNSLIIFNFRRKNDIYQYYWSNIDFIRCNDSGKSDQTAKARAN